MPDRWLRRECVLVCLAAWAGLLAIPLSLGQLGLGWDALNHHIYLGWTAEQHRFDRDFLGAGYQSFQSPYLYWPVYKMATGGWGGVMAAAVLASLHLVAVAPVWMLARTCLPGPTVFDVTMRSMAVALALMSGVALSVFGSTSTDLLGSAPLLWSIALALHPAATKPDGARALVLLSGLCAGLSVALKLSNGPLAVCMPGLWLLGRRKLRGRVEALFVGCLGAITGFLLGYGQWGWLLWRHFGNPVFPFLDNWFVPLRAWMGWAG
ncbi:hypothetical protein JJ685_26445 [Ramlibacter monticola]|uniref:DUF2029 domain-containing protein n=1 Tax=Ramlibacter monticola TaxID=1926872 RepID=A0A936Z8Z0_9BURK|nr:hypothetical protein [Ramlibacter monticola]MBL0394706.1 hypothetical protein [Ramlibacter monticola]